MANWLENRIRRMSQENAQKVAMEIRNSLELEKRQKEEKLRLQDGEREVKAREEGLRQELNGVLEKYNTYSLLQDVKKSLGGGKIVEGYQSGGIRIKPVGSSALALVFLRDTYEHTEGQTIGGESTFGTHKYFSVDGIVINVSCNFY